MTRQLLLALIGRGSMGLIIAAIVGACVFVLVSSTEPEFRPVAVGRNIAK